MSSRNEAVPGAPARAHWLLLIGLGVGLVAALYERPGTAVDHSATKLKPEPPAAAQRSTPTDPHAGVPGAPPLGRPDADPHAGVPGAPPLSRSDADPHAGVPGAPPLGTGMSGAHPLPTAKADSVPVGLVTKAEGALGRTVQELHVKRAELRGQRVRVRGVVVKGTSGILDRNFLHLRDGSGTAPTRDHDLTVTSQDNPKVGETVLFEGTLATDKDFGAGYTYPVILEDAKRIDAPKP